MPPRKFRNLLGWTLALGVLLAFGLVLGGPTESADALSWDRVTRGDLREIITASGEIQARTRISLGTSVMGEIKCIHVVEGQEVKAGDLLVTIDPERLRQGLKQAQAALDGAREDADRLAAARRRSGEAYLRMEQLFLQHLISDEDYRQARLTRDSAELSHRVAMSAVRQAAANVASQRDALDKCLLRAPIAGRVTGLKALKGETAIPGMSNLPGATLMVISDMSDLVAELRLTENEVILTKVGQTAEVTVESLPGRRFLGRVLEIATTADRVGQEANRYLVKVALDMTQPEIGTLRPGMMARAMVLTNEARGVLQVPLQSVVEREGSPEEAAQRGLLGPEARTVIFTVKNGRVHERPFQPGIANTLYIQALCQLAEGEQVLTGPTRRLRDLREGSLVKLRPLSDRELEEEAHTRKGPSS